MQTNGISIQQTLESVLATTCQTDIAVAGAGRTDAGVHALGQVAHFTYNGPPPSLRSINGLLPKDIRVLAIEEVSDRFHSRFSATGKIYHYHLWTEPIQLPFQRLYSLHHTYPLDRDLLQAGIDQLLGTHDFSSFANESGKEKNPVRTIKRIEVVEQKGGLRIEFEGKSFLYKMIRNLVGTLLEVAAGRRSLESIQEILAAKDRRAAGKAALPHGLFLVNVFYDQL